jgi:S-adenosylmethionine:tRNA-ribosyltransferase-isomerase (queuine synthetase)
MKQLKKEEEKKVKISITLNPILNTRMEKELTNKSRLIEKLLTEHYENNGWITLNKKSGGQIGGGKMTNYELEKLKSMCQEEANKYNYRNEFKKNSPSLYEKVRRHKWLDIICDHMAYKYKKKEKTNLLLP